MQQLRVRLYEAQDLYGGHSNGRVACAYACAKLGGKRGSKMYGEKLGKYMKTATKCKPPTNDPQWTMAKDDSCRNTCQTTMRVESNFIDRDLEIEVYDELNMMKSRLIGTTGLIDLERTKVCPKTTGFFHPGDRFDFELRKDGVITGKIFVELEWMDLPMSYVRRTDAVAPPVEKAQSTTPETQTPASSPALSVDGARQTPVSSPLDQLAGARARQTPTNSPALSVASARQTPTNSPALSIAGARQTPVSSPLDQFCGASARQTPVSSPLDAFSGANTRQTPSNSPALCGSGARQTPVSSPLDQLVGANARQTPNNSPALSVASARTDASSRSYAERQTNIDAWLQQKARLGSNTEGPSRTATSNSSTTTRPSESRMSHRLSQDSFSNDQRPRSNVPATRQSRSRSSSSSSSSGSDSSRSASESPVSRAPFESESSTRKASKAPTVGNGDINSGFGDLLQWSSGFPPQWGSQAGGYPQCQQQQQQQHHKNHQSPWQFQQLSVPTPQQQQWPQSPLF